MHEDIEYYVKHCKVCQKNKKQRKKYGHLPPKEAEAQPWEKLCVDMIGPYKLRRKKKTDLTLQAVTMIDPATGWFEIVETNTKSSDVIANKVEMTWLTRYPWPTMITYDHGGEFIGPEFQQLIKEEYGIKAKPASVRNPQANAIIERVHQLLGNMIRSFEIEEKEIDETDPWTGILTAAAWAIRSTYHTTLQATPGQLVFGRDMVWNVNHIADWQYIKQRKQNLIDKNNERENKKRILHDYEVGEKVWLYTGNTNKLESAKKGPYEILKVHVNGTMTIQKGAIEQRVNIRQVEPYKD